MKRVGRITEYLLSIENFRNAEKMARKGKENKRDDIKEFDKLYNTQEKLDAALIALSNLLRDGTFVSTKPTIEDRFTGDKWRKICDVPFYPDRIVHCAVYLCIQERIAKIFIKHMYSYDKGIHELTYNLKTVIREWGDRPLNILKFDITKFYDSISIDIVMYQLRRVIKDIKTLEIIEEMLRLHGSVLIGILLSTLFSGMNLSPLDRFVKEELKVEHYFRFADDFILLHEDKAFLKAAEWRIKNLLYYELGHLTNYALIFDINKSPLGYCGFVHHRTHVRIRQSTKKKFVKTRNNPKSVASYMGMLKWCDSKHLIHKVINKNNYAKKRGNRTEKTSARPRHGKILHQPVCEGGDRL